MEALAVDRLDGADLSVRFAAFSLKGVSTILPWESGRRNVFNLCRWSHNMHECWKTELRCKLQMVCVMITALGYSSADAFPSATKS